MAKLGKQRISLRNFPQETQKKSLLSQKKFPLPEKHTTTPPATPDLLEYRPLAPGAIMNNVMGSLKTSNPLQSSPGGRVVQAKLSIGKPDDKYEQEADNVAKDVVQRINSTGINHIVNPSNPGNPKVQRQAYGSTAISGTAPANFHNNLNRARVGGQSLAPNLQQKMGTAMGADFSGVRIHTGTNAHQLNRSIQAKAFTTGKDIFFKKGAYNPNSQSGQELIAHELTHVVQQNGTSSPSQSQGVIQRTVDDAIAMASSIYSDIVGHDHNFNSWQEVQAVWSEFDDQDARLIMREYLLPDSTTTPQQNPPLGVNTTVAPTTSPTLAHGSSASDSTTPAQVQQAYPGLDYQSLGNITKIATARATTRRGNLNTLVDEYESNLSNGRTISGLQQDLERLLKVKQKGYELIEKLNNAQFKDHTTKINAVKTWLENNIIPREQDTVAALTAMLEQEHGDDSSTVLNTLEDNVDFSRGDLIYGIHSARTEAAQTLDSRHGYNWYYADAYNNYYGIGTGDAFEKTSSKWTKGGKQKLVNQHMSGKNSNVASSTADSPAFARAYYQGIRNSRYAPTKVFDYGQNQLVAESRGDLAEAQKAKAIRKACKFGIGMVSSLPPFSTNQAKIHFILDGLGDLGNIAQKKPLTSVGTTYVPITSSELAFVYRFWSQLRNTVKFYVNQKEVVAPWLTNWTLTGNDGATVQANYQEWQEYGKRRIKKFKGNMPNKSLI